MKCGPCFLGYLVSLGLCLGVWWGYWNAGMGSLGGITYQKNKKFGQHRNMGIWRVVPHCLMWCLWREHGGRSFDDCERTIVLLKLLFFQTLFEWVFVRGSISCVSLHQFFDFFSLRA